MAKRRCGNFEGSFGRKMPATLAAFGLAFALVLTGCGDNGNGGDGGQAAHFGDTLSLSGQVWVENWTDDGIELTQFTGTRAVTAGPLSGTGGITNGQFNFSVASPTAQQLLPIVGLVAVLELEYSFDNVQISNTDAAIAALELGVPNGGLWRGYFSFSETATEARWAEDSVTFIFVDHNVTISGRGATRTFPGGCRCEEVDGDCFCEEWDGECWCDSPPGTRTSSNFNITFREGWNAIRFRSEFRSEGRETATNWSETVTLSHANPGMPVRWVLWEGVDEDYSASLSENLEPSRRTVLGRLPERDGALRPRR